jgi:glycosyltransferase involved in cell wall biosynthesis
VTAGAAGLPGVSRPRIGFDARYVTDRYHGIGRVAANLLAALVELDEVDLVVYALPDGGDTRFDLEALANANGRVTIRRTRAPLLSPQEQASWPVVLRRDRIDLFHSPFVIGPIVGSTPVVVTAHDLILEEYPASGPGRVARAGYRVLAGASLRRARAVIAISEATARELARWYPATRDRTRVIHNAVDPAFTVPVDEASMKRARARYGLPDRFVLAVGAARPHKNHGTLLQALAMIPDAAMRLVLVSAPDPRHPDPLASVPADDPLRARILRIPQVAEEDMPAVYRLATVFVFPSLVEGFGLPLLEAFAVGTPVIASDRSAVAEVAGDAALLFAPEDATALAGLLAQAWDDAALRDRLRAAGSERLRAFSWPRAARQTVDLYREVLRPDSVPRPGT